MLTLDLSPEGIASLDKKGTAALQAALDRCLTDCPCEHCAVMRALAVRPELRRRLFAGLSDDESVEARANEGLDKLATLVTNKEPHSAS